MRKYNTIILDRAKLMEGVNAYCKRNGVSVTGVAKRCGLKLISDQESNNIKP